MNTFTRGRWGGSIGRPPPGELEEVVNGRRVRVDDVLEQGDVDPVASEASEVGPEVAGIEPAGRKVVERDPVPA